jgi:hypothetical protein
VTRIAPSRPQAATAAVASATRPSDTTKKIAKRNPNDTRPKPNRNIALAHRRPHRRQMALMTIKAIKTLMAMVSGITDIVTAHPPNPNRRVPSANTAGAHPLHRIAQVTHQNAENTRIAHRTPRRNPILMMSTMANTTNILISMSNNSNNHNHNHNHNHVINKSKVANRS